MSRALIVASVVVVLTAAAVVAAPVAMVTDLSGAASADGRPVALLDELAPGATISVADGASLTVVYFASGVEFRFSGPAEVAIGEAEAGTTSGAPPSRREVLAAAGAGIRIDPAGKAQASVDMRAKEGAEELVLISPSGQRVLDPRPVFTWRPCADAPFYRFELLDDDFEVVAEGRVGEPRFELAPEIALEPGRDYSWSVSARLVDQTRLWQQHAFVVATAAERELARTLEPAAEAPFSERLVYAVWLEQTGYGDAAARWWAGLEAERPGLRATRGGAPHD